LLSEQGLGQEQIQHMAGAEMEKGVLSLLRCISPKDVRQGVGSDAVANAIACCMALKSACTTDGFLVSELTEPLSLLHTVLSPRSSQLKELEFAVNKLDEHDAAAVDSRSCGAIIEFLLQHSVGKLLTAHATSVLESRGHEVESQVVVEKLSNMSKILTEVNQLDANNASSILAGAHEMDQQVDTALAKNALHKLSVGQRAEVFSIAGSVWDRLLVIVMEMFGSSLAAALELVNIAKVNKGIVDHPTAEEGEFVKGCFNFEEAELLLVPRNVLDHVVWSQQAMTHSVKKTNCVSGCWSTVRQQRSSCKLLVLCCVKRMH
jgi:hypothetical protein